MGVHMCDLKSFKARVKEVVIKSAKSYKENFIEKEYLIYSQKFKLKKSYIISSTESNYMHLVGVRSSLSAKEFYNQCISETLQESDFNFEVFGVESKSLKGSVRRKIAALEKVEELIKFGCKVEESFKKNQVICSIAAATNDITMGFSDGEKSRPKTLLKGFELTKDSYEPDLILVKSVSEEVFNKIIVGDAETLKSFITHNETKFNVSEELLKLIKEKVCD